MLRNIFVLLMLLCFCCSPKQNEPLASGVSYDTLLVPIKNGMANTHLESSVSVRRDTTIKSETKADLKDNLSLYESLQQLRIGNVFEARIINDNDTILRLPQGTHLLIPANAFKTASGNATEVDIHVQEYYSLVDIISANLTTTTKNNILETGGMLYITVSSNGEKCVLRTGQEIQISLPFNIPKPGMQLFTGTPDLLNRIVWEPSMLEETELDDLDDIFTVEHMPEFSGGYQAMVKHIRKNLKYPADARRLAIEGIVFVKFTVDESGTVINPSVLRGIYSSLDKSAIDAISTMPKWKPGRSEGKPVNVSMTFPIRFSLDGSGLTMASNTRNPYIDQQIKNFGENITDSTLKKSDVEEISYYILKTAKLGWINCDRFIDSKETVTYKVYVPNGHKNKVELKLIFQNIRAILPGNKIGDYFYFSNVPINEYVNVLGLRKTNGLEMISRKVKITSATDSLLSFKPIAVADLKYYLESLDKNQQNEN